MALSVKLAVIVAVPFFTPVTLPASTLATFSSELFQVNLEASVIFESSLITAVATSEPLADVATESVVLSIAIDLIVSSLIVSLSVAVLVVPALSLYETVMLAEPLATAVTFPVASTVAILSLSDLYVKPVVTSVLSDILALAAIVYVPPTESFSSVLVSTTSVTVASAGVGVGVAVGVGVTLGDGVAVGVGVGVADFSGDCVGVVDGDCEAGVCEAGGSLDGASLCSVDVFGDSLSVPSPGSYITPGLQSGLGAGTLPSTVLLVRFLTLRLCGT